MTLWQRIKCWFARRDPRDVAVPQGTVPIPEDLRIPSEATHDRLIVEVPDDKRRVD